MTTHTTEATTPTETESPRRGWFATRWLRVVLAVTFLTRLPLPVRGEVTPADLRASMAWYPLVGLGLGALGYGIYNEAGLLFPHTVAAVLAIILLEMCTGALHLDGLMDTCDGIGSGAPRERALAIMKDSRVGAMGVFGAVALVLLKVTALFSFDPPVAFIPLLIGWTAARVIPLWAVQLFPYARAEGTGKVFTTAGGPCPLIFATASVLLTGYFVGRLPGVLLAAVVIVLTLLAQAPIARRLGGLTGDVYGMGIELAETLALLAWLACCTTGFHF